MTRLILLLLLVAAACDSRATASGSVVAAAGPPSKELESCGATAQCADGLRCLDQICTRTARSTVGDYLAARGARELDGGRVDVAVATYAEALATYEGEKLAVPPDLDCAYGLALGRARGTKDKSELAARVLHRCLLALPPGGRLRHAALTTLTELEQDGFDPKQLAKAKLADLYLTHGPAKPPTDRLVVAVSADPPPRGKAAAIINDRLGQADLKTALIACWEQRFAATQSRELSTRIGLKVTYKPSEYVDEPGTYAIALAAAAPGDDAQACVKAAIEPALSGLKTLHDSLDTTLVVSVK